MGVNLCVGTDSLASTDSLSLLEQLRVLHGRTPGFRTKQLLRTIL